MYSFRKRTAIVALPLLLGMVGTVAVFAQSVTDRFVLDDFTSENGESAIGTRWEAFTDRVMGGRSDMQAGYIRLGGDTVLRMMGDVSLENNGGFVQVRLPLLSNGFQNADEWEGFFLTVRGRPGSYYMHLRDDRTVFPWSYYKAAVDVDESWQTVLVPFSGFEPESMPRGSSPNLQGLRSVALVAAGGNFRAQVDMREIGLYR